MNKQFILIALGLALLASLFFFGKTFNPQKPVSAFSEKKTSSLDIEKIIDDQKSHLTASQAMTISKLENIVSRGSVKDQQIQAYRSLANYYRDSVKALEPYLFYTYNSAKLENSEKSLTFAAQLFLSRLRTEHDDAKLDWETTNAIALFEQALLLNPNSVDLKLGLGSAYIFGRAKTTGDPQQTMRGIQQVLSVVKEDSTNMKAQLLLGIGGYTSKQYSKAIERFKKVVAAEPSNVEAIVFLADTYAANGNNAEAIKWYERSKALIHNKDYGKEVDERIKMLK